MHVLWVNLSGKICLIAQGGTMPNSPMPGFAEQLSTSEMEMVLSYIKIFWNAEERVFQMEISQRHKELFE